MAFYLESYDRPPESAPLSEDIFAGEALVINGSGEAAAFDGSQHTLGDFVGVADNPFTGDQIREHDEDNAVDELYDASDDNERVTYGGDADRDRIRVKTPEDAGGNESAPSISHGDVVGFVDTSAGTLTSTDEYHGRIVEEGYTDGEATPTTYNRSNNNFVALGVAYRDDEDSYDAPVRVEVRHNL